MQSTARRRLPDEVSPLLKRESETLIGLDVHAVDMLANDGKALDDSNNADVSVKQRLDYALK
jgi:hypothetical protein